ncbi:outer membrane protein transport protein [uncultured Salinisphaera sp.]|uniref:OmpP1/FadL family transporter n=1 Tax=uncultured Salinisphaera sp. TaxID=359372 RepID=UPI0032B2CBF9|tara:strand:+ start:5447 stop:6589 length:1143 start_codon:yes stop_codon:yes gene_type:complete
MFKNCVVAGLGSVGLLGSSVAMAGGLQRTTQSVSAILTPGNYAEISYTRVVPDITGTGTLSGVGTGDAAENFNLPAGLLKVDLTDRLAAGLFVDQPFGIDLEYADDMPEFGGTDSTADSIAFTGVLAYTLPYEFTLFGGVRQQRVGGNVTLQGLGYGPLSGYNVDFRNDWGTGWLAGVAYERPEIALRVALTYNSRITHKLPSRERVDTVVATPVGAVPVSLDQSSVTSIDTPESWLLEARTGIAPNTVAFGSVRYVEHEKSLLEPELFTNLAGRGLVDFDDTITYELGVGYRFTSFFSGSVSGLIEEGNSAPYTPLRVAGDRQAVALGGLFQLTERVTFGTGLSYFWLNGSPVSTSGDPLAEFDDGRFWAFTGKIGVAF